MMIFRVADNTNPASLASQMRHVRMRKFADLLAGAGTKIRMVDVGGSASFWQIHRKELPEGVSITIVNTKHDETPAWHWVNYVEADARRMHMFADQEFDICFSNSVIEHVGTDQDQRAMADEIRRVACGYFVQTPNWHFPLEPHFLVPGWQYLPVSLRVQLLRRRDWGWIKRIPDPVEAREAIESIRLLTAARLRGLFPDAHIYREKIGPFTKSLIASHPPTGKRIGRGCDTATPVMAD